MEKGMKTAEGKPAKPLIPFSKILMTQPYLLQDERSGKIKMENSE